MRVRWRSITGAYLAGLTSTLGVLIAAVNSQCRLIFNAGRDVEYDLQIGRAHV